MRGLLKLMAVLVCGSLILLWLPLEPAFADGSPEYSLAAPELIGLGDFTSSVIYNSENMSEEYKTITASTTDPNMTRVTISVRDAKTNYAGYLTLNGADAADAVRLDHQLQVKGGPQQPDYTTLTGSDITLVRDGSLDQNRSYTIDNFNVQQTITTSDLSKTAGPYQLTLTFTATFNY